VFELPHRDHAQGVYRPFARGPISFYARRRFWPQQRQPSRPCGSETSPEGLRALCRANAVFAQRIFSLCFRRFHALYPDLTLDPAYPDTRFDAIEGSLTFALRSAAPEQDSKPQGAKLAEIPACYALSRFISKACIGAAADPGRLDGHRFTAHGKTRKPRELIGP